MRIENKQIEDLTKEIHETKKEVDCSDPMRPYEYFTIAGLTLGMTSILNETISLALIAVSTIVGFTGLTRSSLKMKEKRKTVIELETKLEKIWSQFLNKYETDIANELRKSRPFTNIPLYVNNRKYSVTIINNHYGIEEIEGYKRRIVEPKTTTEDTTENTHEANDEIWRKLVA